MGYPQTRAAGFRGASPTLVGRQRELGTLQGLLEAVRSGGSGTLVVDGEPGIGKSALLERLIGSASDFRVTRAVGVEREVDLPYASLHQLCRPMIDTVDALPPRQRHALHVVFGLSVERDTRPYAGMNKEPIVLEQTKGQRSYPCQVIRW